MNFILSKNELSNHKRFGNVSYKGNVSIVGNYLIYLKGFVFPNDYNENDILNIYINDGISSLKALNGEYTIVIYDKIINEIVIINDKIGRKNLWVYYYKDEFIISDSFWEIVSTIKPSISDIDEESVKEWAFLFFPLENKTIIRNLEYFPSANVGIYNLKDKILKKSRYWNFSDVETDNTTPEDELSNVFYEKIDKGIKFIKKKHGNDKIFACSVSGGLDSRISPHFCLKNNMNTFSFNITGRSKPNYLLFSRLHNIIKKIVKHYGIKHYFINDAHSPIKEKIKIEIKNYPFGVTNFNTAVTRNIPKFDVHINAGGPEMMSTTITGVEKIMTKNDFANYIFNKLSLMYQNESDKRTLIKKIINVFKISNTPINRNRSALLSIEDMDKMRNKILKYCEYDNNTNNYYGYLYQQIASKTGNGSYESLSGTKTSYSIFFPFVTDFLMALDPNFVINRKVLKNLLKERFPELAKIPCEHDLWGVTFENQKKNSFMNKWLILEKKVLRRYSGPGLHLLSIDNKKELSSYLSIKNDTFFKLFDKNEIEKLTDANFKSYLQFIKVKIVLDIILYKKWNEYV